MDILNEVHSVGSNKDPEILGHKHDFGAGQFKPHTWKHRNGEDFRRCSYCGSINPDDLITLANQKDLHFEVADWKYGWPHKVYVDGGRIKFYTNHVIDTRNAGGISTLLFMKTGIHFEVKDNEVWWKIPKKERKETEDVGDAQG